MIQYNNIKYQKNSNILKYNNDKAEQFVIIFLPKKDS